MKLSNTVVIFFKINSLPVLKKYICSVEKFFLSSADLKEVFWFIYLFAQMYAQHWWCGAFGVALFWWKLLKNKTFSFWTKLTILVLFLCCNDILGSAIGLK